MKKITREERAVVFEILAAGMRIEKRLDRALSMVRGISLSEYLLLRALGKEHEATATRVVLADAVGLTPSGVTRALRPLEKLGYVTTKRDERDARRSLASLTKHGVTLVQNASKVVDETLADLKALRELTPTQRTRVQGFLEGVASD